jgi:hypothetical protein
MKPTRGFALLAVLWLVVMLGTLVFGCMHALTSELHASANRVALERGRWAAEACVARLVSTLDSLAFERHGLGPTPAVSLAFSGSAGCSGSVWAPQAFLNRDSASSVQLALLDSLIHRTVAAEDSFVTQDGDGRIEVNDAPFQVLATLPGVGADGAEGVVAARASHRLQTLSSFLDALPYGARERAMARYDELQGKVIFAPTSLIVLARGQGDRRGVPVATVELLVVDAGGRIATIRKRVS